ncbi:MAG: RluA family pseudouridine synthase [Synergistaceae bacterium]|jgi:23S rRNA pseudouridine955/2504/2580 synthase|nr:RluA family pseudouridine synthase [Synergistaceae bacterium]
MGNEFYITIDQAGRRIDRLLRTTYPHVSLGAIMKAIRKGEVRLNGEKVSVSTRLEEGQFLQVPWQKNVSESFFHNHAQNETNHSPIETIYKDNHIWVLNKPAGLLTQPNVKNGDSLITRALSELNWTRTDFCPATVQRLDRNTSGLVIIAMSGLTLRVFSEVIRSRNVKKIYYAVVLGDIQNEGEIDAPLLKDPESNTVKIDKDGQNALTRYKKLASIGKFSIVEIELVTGRPHQARVHMSSVGHPILGDKKYGGGNQAARPMLHSYSITLPQDLIIPEELRNKTFVAPIPKDMLCFFN